MPHRTTWSYSPLSYDPYAAENGLQSFRLENPDSQTLGIPGLSIIARGGAWIAKKLIPGNLAELISKKGITNIVGKELGEKALAEIGEAGLEQSGEIAAKKLTTKSLQTGNRKATEKALSKSLQKGVEGMTEETADKIAKRMVKAEVRRQATMKATSRLATAGLLAGGGYGVWRFGTGAASALGDAAEGLGGKAGDAIADGMNNVMEWAGNNPFMAIGFTLLIGFVILMVIMWMLKPLFMAKDAVDAVVGKKEEPKPEASAA